MPARVIGMESPSVVSSQVDGAGEARRKSGRVTKRPEHLEAADFLGSAKRKRHDDAETQDSGEGSESEDASNDDEDDLDDEELRERRRKVIRTGNRRSAAAARRGGGASRTTDLTIRPAAKKASGNHKARRARPSAAAGIGGLYGEVFGGEKRLDDVAAQWLGRFRQHESGALTEVINFVLRCAGCEITVTSEDIEDPDNCADRLIDVQDMFQTNAVVDYPLIARSKGAQTFKRDLTDFMTSLIRTIAESNIMYEQTELMENIQVWFGTMSSAASRPFRHTSTLVSLAIVSSLCDIGSNLQNERALTLRQIEGEKKKGRVNKARVADLQKQSEVFSERITKVNEIIREWFDVVFVHRYRDVDPRIRVDCVTYLSNWIVGYPDQFFDDQHLRYLGWILSDTSSSTRLEVVKQLQRLFVDKDRVTGLKQFTERFRPRLVEIATQDAEHNVRAAAVELLDILRDVGLLEPDDIDAIGKLIFDIEPRVRKAVVSFFAASVQDVYESKLEDAGGLDAVQETLASKKRDSGSDKPELSWLKLKALAEVLNSYDSQDDGGTSKHQYSGNYLLANTSTESRFGLATDALMDDVDEVQDWEKLAAFILHDHSQHPSKSRNDPRSLFLQACKPEEKEELILLEVLNTSVRHSLQSAAEAAAAANKSKAQKQKEAEQQEQAAQRLCILIPKLLNKFGALPDTASAVLRLERVLDLDVFQDLRQDSTTFAALLDDINKQFMSHESQDVLAEATAAILHAKGFGELEGITDSRLQTLWDDTTYTLVSICKGQLMPSRGSLGQNALNALSNTVIRISHLAGISSCVEPLEALKALKAEKSRKKQQGSGATSSLPLLISLVNRGVPSRNVDVDTSRAEDNLVIHACKSLLFYFMWKVRDLKVAIESGATGHDSDLEQLIEHKDATISSLRTVIEHRQPSDDLRQFAAGTIVDLYILFSTLRHVKSQGVGNASARPSAALSLIQPISHRIQTLLLQTFTASESAFAKKTRRTLEAPDIDDEPEGSDDEADASDNDIDDIDDNEAIRASSTGAGARGLSTSALLAEEKFCAFASKLVLAIIARVLDASPTGLDDADDYAKASKGPVAKRLLRNKARLGPNFKEVCAFLERGGLPASAAGRKGASAKGKSTDAGDADDVNAKAAQTLSRSKKAAKSAATVAAEDDDEDDEEEEDEDDDDDDNENALRRRELLVDGDGDVLVEDVGDQGDDDDDDVESVLGD